MENKLTQHIRSYRKERGMPREELAEKMGLIDEATAALDAETSGNTTPY